MLKECSSCVFYLKRQELSNFGLGMWRLSTCLPYCPHIPEKMTKKFIREHILTLDILHYLTQVEKLNGNAIGDALRLCPATVRNHAHKHHLRLPKNRRKSYYEPEKPDFVEHAFTHPPRNRGRRWYDNGAED